MIVALRDRVKTLKEMAERARLWYAGIEAWDEAAVAKHLRGAGDTLRAARAALAAAPEWTPAAVDAALRGESGVVGQEEERGDELRAIEFDRIAGGKRFDATAPWFIELLADIGQA